jgi:hypothetical protein
MVFFNRKGQTFMSARTVGLLFAIIVLMLLFSSLLIFRERGESPIVDWVCRASVYLSHQTSGAFEKIPFVPSTLLCKTKYKNLVEKDKNRFMEKVAKDMRQCWKIWGEGEWEPSPNWLTWDQNKCFTCTKMEASGTVPDVTMNDFLGYLQTTNIEDDSDTYWNYFRGVRGNSILFNFPNAGTALNTPLFKKGGFYGITYVNDVKVSFVGRVLGGATTGAVVLGVTCSPAGPLGIVICGTKGFIVGGVATGVGEGIKRLFTSDVDGIMLGEFNAVENKCDVGLE